MARKQAASTAAAVQAPLRTLGAHTEQERLMRNTGKAPTFAVWIICLILYAVALAAHFGVVAIGAPVAVWSWILGFGLLLVACRVKGL
jgi:hypothetical protein